MSRTPKKTPKSIRIELTHKPNPSTPQEAAEYYLTSGEVNARNACYEALDCLFSPLGTALARGSQSEVEAAISASEVQFKVFMLLARNRSRKDISHLDSLVKPTPKTDVGETEVQLAPTLSNGQLAQIDEPDELLDLENERF